MKTRDGVALLAALLALLCASALLIAFSLTVRQEFLLSAAVRDSERAFAAAERAAWTAAAALDSTDVTTVSGVARYVPVEHAPADTAAAALTRIAPLLFMASGEAGVRGIGGLIWRRVGVFLRAIPDSSGLRFEPLPDRAWAELP